MEHDANAQDLSGEITAELWDETPNPDAGSDAADSFGAAEGGADGSKPVDEASNPAPSAPVQSASQPSPNGAGPEV